MPVFKYESDGAESKVGTTGVYIKTGNLLVTGAAKLGNVPVEELPQAAYWRVPGVGKNISFDVFPGAPSITDGFKIAFKGNFVEEEVPKTGVFFRQITSDVFGGTNSVQLIANSNTDIPPNPWNGCSEGTKFGSTAPPSAHGNTVVFAGFDNEEEPSCGGIYMAPLAPNPTLEPLINIGDEVPTLQDAHLSHVGEGLSYDGSIIAFWGSWGDRGDTKKVRVFCPTTGNKDRMKYCQDNSSHDGAGNYYQDQDVPVNQGIFVFDTKKARLFLVARTGEGGDGFDDFLFWNYSGKPPASGTGHGGEGEVDGADGDGDDSDDAHPPRFRSSAFVSVNSVHANGVIMFKARKGEQDNAGVYMDPIIDGIYYKKRGNDWSSSLSKMVETGMDSTIFDAEAVVPVGFLETGSAMTVSEIGMEREALRGRFVVLTLRFGAQVTALEEADDEEDVVEFAGIYIANMPAG